MSFNTDKCKVMHIGDKNPNFKYKMRDQELDKVKQKKDLGLIIYCNLEVSDQCIAASKKVNMMLEFNPEVLFEVNNASVTGDNYKIKSTIT